MEAWGWVGEHAVSLFLIDTHVYAALHRAMSQAALELALPANLDTGRPSFREASIKDKTNYTSMKNTSFRVPAAVWVLVCLAGAVLVSSLSRCAHLWAFPLT